MQLCWLGTAVSEKPIFCPGSPGMSLAWRAEVQLGWNLLPGKSEYYWDIKLTMDRSNAAEYAVSDAGLFSG